MQITPIKNKRDYKAALKEIERLMDSQPNTPDGDKLDVLATLVEVWEQKHFPIEIPDPISTIIFVMEQKNMKRADLEPYIGHRGRVSEVLNRKRSLTLEMIRKLHSGLGIPAEILIA